MLPKARFPFTFTLLLLLSLSLYSYSQVSDISRKSRPAKTTPAGSDTSRMLLTDTTRNLKKDSTQIRKNKLNAAQVLKNKIAIDSIKKHRDSTQVSYFYGDFEKLGKLHLHPNDTAIIGFENYNQLYKYSRFYATMGNFGQCSKPLTPFSFLRESGFDYGIHTMDPYLYQNDSIKYYRVYKTYSELTYVQGANKEQNFHAVFSRNVYRSLNLGFDFRTMNSPGAYVHQRTNHINFVLTAQFITKKQRYGIIANVIYNRLKIYENGGIKNESVFENGQESNRMVIPVNLESAQNNIRETGFFMKHFFNLSRHPNNDRDTSLAGIKRFELGRLTYSFQYDRQSQNFVDGNASGGFFPTPVLDTLNTYDSVSVKTITNELNWSNPTFNPKNKLRVIQLEGGIKNKYTEVTLHGTKNVFNQFIPHAEIDFTPFPSLILSGRGDYVLGKYNEGDKSLRVKMITILGTHERNAGIITVTANYLYQKPGWFYEHYLGNSYRWDTAWQRQSVISAGFNYRLKFLETGIDLSRISNYVYLGTDDKPKQFVNGIAHMFVYLNTNLEVWNFTLKSQLAYQTIQGSNVIRLPAFLGNVSLYYTRKLFNGAATLEPGLTFFYNTSYFADNFNPALRSFYLQDRREIGNSLYIDGFINLKIQRARFFVALTHLNAALMGRDYYATPYYPMQDGAFKFGIAWRFHD